MLSETQENALAYAVRESRRDRIERGVAPWWGKPTIAALIRKGMIEERKGEREHELTPAGRAIGAELVDAEELASKRHIAVMRLAEYASTPGAAPLEELVAQVHEERKTSAVPAGT